MRNHVCTFIIIFFSLLHSPLSFSQIKSLDAKFIASNYYKGVVKILLYDSLAAKKDTNVAYIGRGSGFIVSEDGIIFTNRHVVEMCVLGYANYDYYNDQSGETNTYIETYSEDLLSDSNLVKINRIGYPVPIVQVYYGKGEDDYKLYYAKVLSLSMGSFDGAVLKIVSDTKGNSAEKIFQPVPIGNSDSTFQGEDLCIYGYPAQYEGGFNLMLKDMSTLTFGKHSGFDYVFNKDFGYIKTDAAINSGNSGGPVFNQENKVVGIATATSTKTNIGLIGGINAMYFIVSPEVDVLQKLSSKGLKIPQKAGSIKTISGEHKIILTTKQIEEVNKKNMASFEIKKTKREQQKQNEMLNAYSSVMMRPKSKIFLFAAAGASTYQRGNLDLLWQSINNDASVKATGSGNPFVWNAGIHICFSTKKESKGYGGFGIEYFSTSKNAIGASNQRENVLNNISLNLKEILFTFPLAYQLNNKLAVNLEPGIMYFGFAGGTITAYGNTYKETNTLIGTGWNISAGITRTIKKHFGIYVRAGYHHLIEQEVHKDDRGGYSLSYSFFANGTDGKTTMINWNGFYLVSGLYFSFDGKARNPANFRMKK